MTDDGPAAVGSTGRAGPWVGRLDRPLLAIVVVYLIAGAVLAVPRITADGLQYFSQTRSVVLDGDLDLDDEYRFDPALVSPGANAGRREFMPRDLDGRFLHSANEGIVVLFAPFFLLGHGVSALIDAAGGSVSMDGYDLPYVLAVTFGSGALVALAMALLARFAAVRVGWKAAVLGACAVWLGSSLVQWSLFRPAHAHGPAVLLETIIVLAFLGRGRDPRSLGAWLTMGIAWGLLISVRPVGGLYAVVPAGWLAWWLAASLLDRRRPAGAVDGSPGAPALGATIAAGLRVVVPAGLAFLLGGAIGRLPQVLLTGDLTLAGSSYYDESGYLSRGGDDPLTGLVSLLLDSHQGTLLWVPLVGLSLLGLAAYWRRDRLVTVAGLVWVAAIWAFVATLGNPERFGGPTLASRHLVEATPIYVLGAAGVPVLFGALWPRRRRAMKYVGAVVILVATGWGLLQHVATEVVPGTAALTPLERFGRVLEEPGELGRLLFVPGRNGGPGEVFIAGRVAGALRGAADIREALLGLGLLALFALFIALAAGPAWRLVAGERPARAGPEPAGVGKAAPAVGGRRAGLIVLSIVLIAAAVAALPALLPSRLTSADGTRVAAAWTGGPGPIPAGRVDSITVGSSVTGNEALSPPAASPGEPGGVGSGSPSGYAAIDDGLEGTVLTDPAWASLAGVVVGFEGAADTTGIEAWVAGPGSAPAVVSRVVAAGPGSGEVTLTLPLALSPGQAEALRVGVRSIDAGSGIVPRVAVTASGDLAVRPLGVPAVLPAVPDVAGVPLTPSAWSSTPLAEQESLLVRSDGTAAMRFGPWNPELLLRNAVAPRGWRIPGPSAAPGSWTDSTVPSERSGPLGFRLVAPWPIRSATVHAMVTALDRRNPETVQVDGSTDGGSWQSLAQLELEPIVGQQHVAGTFDPGDGASAVSMRVDLSGSPGAVGLNAVWFDLALEPPAGVLDRVDSSSIVVSTGSQPSAPVEVVVAQPLSAIESVAFAASDGITGVVAAIPAGLLLVVAAILGAAAWAVRRRYGPWPAVGLATIAVVALAVGLLGLPRDVQLPRTQSFEAGTGAGATVTEADVTATQDGGTYESPIIAVPAGGSVRGVELEGDVTGALVEVRPVATDETAGPWQPAAGTLTSPGDGVQVRVTFAAPGQVLNGIRLVVDPPIGG